MNLAKPASRAIGPHARVIAMVGKKFSMLTVVAEHINQPGEPGGLKWDCLCDCGNMRAVKGVELRRGSAKSCGCHFAAKPPKKTGKFYTPEYAAWRNFKQRCQNEKLDTYRHYGGRGITVCPEWEVFDNFLRDMGPRPSPKHSLDRIDVNKGCCPENCRWATKLEQVRNQRANVFIEMDGVKKCISEWAYEYGLQIDTLRYRIRQGWPVKLALTSPPGVLHKAARLAQQVSEGQP